MKPKTFLGVFWIAVFVCTASAVTGFATEKKADTRLQNATTAFREIMQTPEKGIPRDLFEKAQCAVIIPGLKKGALIVGGKYGRGYASCREGKEGWGPPAGVRIEGGSWGLQLGGSSTDVLMLIMNQSGMNRLLSDKFTIGGEAAAAAGPVGRETSANTDVLLKAEILSWSRSRGLFAGLSLEGATLHADKEENEKLYGKPLSNKEILQGETSTPKVAMNLICALDEYTPAVTSPCGAATARALRTTGKTTLSEVHFDTGKAEILPDSEGALNAAANALTDNPNWKVRVEGYTDNVGSASSNMELSKRRAEAVMNWLADHGVDRSRLTAKGYGESRPVADNTTDEGRAKNRRVDLVRIT